MFKIGDTVRIAGNEPGLAMWSGLECEVVALTGLAHAYLTPMAPRPDAGGWMEFYWPTCDLERAG